VVDWLLLILPGVIWGASFLFIAEGLEALAPNGVTFVRIFVGFLTLSMIPAARRPLARSDRAATAALGVLWLAFPLSMFPFAEQRVSSALTGMLNGANPLFATLVAAYIGRAERRYREWFDEVTKADDRTAAARIVALFEALAERTRPEICRGCPFLMALTEFPDTEVEAHQSSVRLKEWVHARLRRLAKEHAAACTSHLNVGALADHLTLLFEGVYATVPALGADGPAKRARQLAESLVGLR